MNLGNMWKASRVSSIFDKNNTMGKSGFDAEELTAGRVLWSSGIDQTKKLLDELLSGDAVFKRGSLTGGVAKTTLVDGVKQIDLSKITEGDIGLMLGIILSHEAMRDGVEGTDQEQAIETFRSVLTHSVVGQMVGNTYGMASLDASVIADIKALQTGDMNAFARYALGKFDSSADLWKLMGNGDLVEDGDGWLRDQNGNYKLDKNGNKIGAEGIETGLLNILNGGTSGVAYSEFTDEQILAAQGLMTRAGFRPFGGNSPRTYMWTKGNDGIGIGSNSILSGFGDSVAAPLLMNGLDELSDSVVNGDVSAFFDHDSVPSKAQSRFINYLTAKMNFYGGTHQLLSSDTLANARISGWFGYDEHYADDQHKGGDFAAQKDKSITGEPILAYFGGKVVDIRKTPESTSSGNSVFVEHGFNFENYFYSTGVRSQYMHMENNPAFKINEMVSANTQMGTLGKYRR